MIKEADDKIRRVLCGVWGRSFLVASLPNGTTGRILRKLEQSGYVESSFIGNPRGRADQGLSPSSGGGIMSGTTIAPFKNGQCRSIRPSSKFQSILGRLRVSAQKPEDWIGVTTVTPYGDSTTSHLTKDEAREVARMLVRAVRVLEA